MYADAKRVLAAGVASGGSGYVVGDELTLSGGRLLYDDTHPAAFLVTAVGGAGEVASVEMTAAGAYSSAPLQPYATTGGSGSGFVPALTFTIYWDSAAWVSLTGADLQKLLSQDMIDRANQTLSGDTSLPEGLPQDGSGTKRTDALVAVVAREARRAVARGHRVPLSVGDDGAYDDRVPPEAEAHVLSVAAWRLLNSTPNLQAVIVTDKGVYAPLGALATAGQKWIDDAAAGRIAPTWPDQPDPAWKPAVRTGSVLDPADLESYGASAEVANV